jgi:hypothetical protein
VAFDTSVYGDSAGTRDNPYTALCAYIGKPRAWKAMNRDWSDVIKPRGLQEVHAVDLFAHSHYATSDSRNPYKDWSLYDIKVFIDELAEAIRKHRRSIRPISIVVKNDDFHSLDPGERRLLTSGRFLHWDNQGMKWKTSGKPSEPYMLVLQALMKRAFEMSDPNSKVHFIFDTSDNDGISKDLARQIIDRNIWPESSRMGDLKASKSEVFPGIQMADLHAFILNRYVQSQSGHIDGMRLEEEYAQYMLFGAREEYEMVGMPQMQATIDIAANPTLREWLRTEG